MPDVRLLVVNSSRMPAGRCAVCGHPVGEGEGIEALYDDRILRFRCVGCLARFRRDPELYLARSEDCCPTEAFPQSPASEWTV